MCEFNRCDVWFRFDEKLEVEIAAVTRQKDIEMAHAISEIRTETDALVAKAKAEREEFLQLYTKVCISCSLSLIVFPF